MKYVTILIVSILLCPISSFSQDEEKENKESFGIDDTLSNVFRPRIGLHIGTLGYFGEIQNNQKGMSGITARMGYGASLSAPLTRYLRLEFSFIFGQVSANERSLQRNLNFKSRIRSGGIHLLYNFYPLLPQKVTNVVNPIVGVGFTGFEFLSKTDAKDQYGNTYHYWSDGSIRDMAESDPNAYLANEIQRDYTYETDLREQNLDGLGKYTEYSFAVPLTIGAEFHLSPRVDFRFTTAWHLTFTDLVDNYTYKGTGERQGDKKKDQFLYTSISLSYDLVFKKSSNKPKTFDEPEFNLRDMALTDSTDTDLDGVYDLYDECAWTPLEAEVDENGCPVDSDLDGVPDYRDDEPYFTAENAIVDEYGVSLTQDDLEYLWLKYTDSTGEYVEFINDFRSISFTGRTRRKTVDKSEKHVKNFVVVVGKEHKDVSANDLQKYLGYNDFETVVKNDTVYYIIGKYDNISDAVAAKSSLEDQGVEVKEISTTKDGVDQMYKVKDNIVAKVDSINKVKGVEVKVEESNKGVQYRIQIGAFSKRVNTDNVFPGIDNIIFNTSKDGLTRYYTGQTTDVNEAVKDKNRLREKGYSSAFVVAYKDGKRVTMEEAGVKTTESYDASKELETFTESELNASKDSASQVADTTKPEKKPEVFFRVKVGEFVDEVPTETLDAYLQIGGIRPKELEDGRIIYYSKKLSTIEEAEQLMQSYQDKGLKEAKIIGEKDGTIISREEAIELINQNE